MYTEKKAVPENRARQKRQCKSCLLAQKPRCGYAGYGDGGAENMDFGEQLKSIRAAKGLTQEQVAACMNVSRQAVSNWENNKNLPDLEMVVKLAVTFGVSLDQLILGGKNMNNMTEKLIRDGSETRKAKMNLLAAAIGAVLLVMGAGCLLIKGMSVEYVDAQGLLHENFFLLPIGFLLMFSGTMTIVVSGICGFAKKRAHRR